MGLLWTQLRCYGWAGYRRPLAGFPRGAISCCCSADRHKSAITVARGEEKSNRPLGQERIAGPRTVLFHWHWGGARLRLDEGDFAVEVGLLFRVEFQGDAASCCDALQHRE
jgi:hypothetical protein